MNRILNRLREIDVAKERWAADHPNARAAELTEKELIPYLSRDFWQRSLRGERYLIHGLDESPEAEMTRDVDWIPKGKELRLD